MIDTVEKAKRHLREVCEKIADNYDIDAQMSDEGDFVDVKMSFDGGTTLRASSVPSGGDSLYSEHALVYAENDKMVTLDSTHELSPHDYMSMLDFFFAIGGNDEP